MAATKAALHASNHGRLPCPYFCAWGGRLQSDSLPRLVCVAAILARVAAVCLVGAFPTISLISYPSGYRGGDKSSPALVDGALWG